MKGPGKWQMVIDSLTEEQLGGDNSTVVALCKGAMGPSWSCKIMSHFFCSVKTRHLLYKKQEESCALEHYLVFDVRTRWNSTYVMHTGVHGGTVASAPFSVCGPRFLVEQYHWGSEEQSGSESQWVWGGVLPLTNGTETELQTFFNKPEETNIW